MRGTLLRRVIRQDVDGIIPAYAGNTNVLRPMSDVWEDHPRVCGEHRYRVDHREGRRGSSPRMRGTRDDAVVVLGHDGIIPAYAGNTGRPSFNRSANRDHPRVCGEHVWTSVWNSVSSGSSPRMRGTREHGVGEDAFAGIIPAYAGNTCMLRNVP